MKREPFEEGIAPVILMVTESSYSNRRRPIEDPGVSVGGSTGGAVGGREGVAVGESETGIVGTDGDGAAGVVVGKDVGGGDDGNGA